MKKRSFVDTLLNQGFDLGEVMGELAVPRSDPEHYNPKPFPYRLIPIASRAKYLPTSYQKPWNR